MSFTALGYLPALGLIALVLALVPQGRPRLVATTAISLGFYVGLAGWNVLVLVVVAALAYGAGQVLGRLSDGAPRRWTLVAAIALLLAPLLFYKYAAALLGVAISGSPVWSTLNDLALPVGVSFYTFLAVGYVIDVYIGKVQAERDPARFGAMMTFFPHLAAGPIERAGHLLPQLAHIGAPEYGRIVAGLRLILLGLVMKLAIADTLAPTVEAVYSAPRGHGAIDLILATVYFSFQVYADFAGYSLIAIGSARIVGIDLLVNFQQPWLSTTLPEYWRRWHISLSSWFRDYVFVPLQLQMRRWGARGLALALVFTFVLVGIWHGAGAKYALFGLIHGVLVAGSTLTLAARNRFWKARGVPQGVIVPLRIAVTFALITLTFVLFRASDTADALWIYGQIAGGQVGVLTVPLLLPAVLVVVLIAGDLLVLRGFKFGSLPFVARWGAYYVGIGLVIWAFMRRAEVSMLNVDQFIYYQF